MGEPSANRFDTPKSSRGYEVYTYCVGVGGRGWNVSQCAERRGHMIYIFTDLEVLAARVGALAGLDLGKLHHLRGVVDDDDQGT